MRKTYYNGIAIYLMTPREAAKFELMYSDNITTQEAEDVIVSICNEALKNLREG